MKSTPQFNKRPSFYTARGVEAEVLVGDARQQTVCRDVMIFFFATGDAFMTSYINQPRSLRRTARFREVWRERSGRREDAMEDTRLTHAASAHTPARRAYLLLQERRREAHDETQERRVKAELIDA